MKAVSGINVLLKEGAERNFEIGRVLQFKSEIGKLKSDSAGMRDAARSDLSFPISDLNCRTRPISKFPRFHISSRH
jgi:hypothetical protein